MAVIGVKSITGITSITNAAGGANVLTFHSNNTTERLRIESGGDVGIGTVNPSRRLHVTDYGDHGVIRIEGSGNTKRSGIEFYRETSAGVGKGGAAIWVESDTSSSAGKLRFGTANNAGIQSQNTDMILDSNGRLGIGTDIPSQELTVYGDDPIISVQEASVSSQVDMGTGTSTGFINIQKADGTRTIQLNGSGNSYFTDGNFGIGVNNPDCLFHIQGTEISGYGAHGNTKLCVEHDGNTAIEIVSSANYLGGIYFSDSGADGVGKIEYYHGTAGDNMRFNTNGSEKLRIDSSGNVAIGHTVAYHNYAVGATGTSTKLAVVQTTGTGWKEMAHIVAGTDSDNTGSVVRLSHYGNDRGAYLKAGRGTSDRAIAYFGLRNSSNTDTDLLTFRQDSSEYRTITNSEFRFNIPTNAERAIVAFGNHSTSYSLGSSGGAAIRFKNTSGDHSIEFDTHWSGQHHSTAMTLGRSGSLITRDSRDASIGRDYTTGTLTNGQSVSYNGSGTTLTNGKLNLNSVGGNGGGWIGCLSVSSTDGNPSGAAMIMGVHGQGFNVYNKLLDNFDGGITVTWASGNWSYQISNSSGDTIKYRFTVIHMGTYNTTSNGR